MEEISLSIAPVKNIAGGLQAQEFLAFTLGREEYGIHILGVQELRSYENVTCLANAPDFIKGVINLRGIIVPIVDLRIKFDLEVRAYDEFTVVVIVNIGAQTIGLVVDSVSDVVILGEDKVKPAPQVGTALDTAHLIGLGTVGERMIILIDIDKLMFGMGMGPLALAA